MDGIKIIKKIFNSENYKVFFSGKINNNLLRRLLNLKNCTLKKKQFAQHEKQVSYR